MTGKTVLVTGATGGIGLETARALARAGGRAELCVIDLASFASTREAAGRVLAAHPALDVLVNNAGTAVRERRLTADAHEVTWQTNYLGHFLLTQLLLPALRAARPRQANVAARPRLVNVASEAHRSGRIDFSNLELERGYAAFRAYANTKLAQVLFARELARREPGVAVTAVHPGTIATGIWRPAPAWARLLIRVLLARPEKGAAPVVRLASAADVEGVTGAYFKRFREATPSAAARDDASARRLWEVSERSLSS